MAYLSKTALETELKGLPDETLRAYETSLTKIAMSPKVKSFDNWVNNVLDLKKLDEKQLSEIFNMAKGENEEIFDQWLNELMGLPTDTSKDDIEEKVAFAAFAIKVNQLRRNQNFSEEEQLLESYRFRFEKNHKFFKHLELMCLQDSKRRPSNEYLLALAQSNIKLMPQNSGVYHAFAVLVAEIYEKGDIEDLPINNIQYKDLALKAVQQAIDFEPTYAKFYATRGRLLALDNKYSEAYKDFEKAIDLENSNNSDYALRIQTYRGYMQRVVEQKKTDELRAQLQENVDEAKENYEKLVEEQHQIMQEAKDAQVKNMEFLGLFAGIISFTIGGISIATGMSFTHPAHLAGILLILMGALLGVFAGFASILHGFKKPKAQRNIICFVTGLIIIAIGLVLLLCI